MRDYADYTGKKFGRLYVVGKCAGTKAQWVCQCECGTVRTYMLSKLKEVKSCGCLEEENRHKLKERATTHGMTNTILYSKYCGMKERIHNPNYPYYFRYGGRGIKICEEWEKSFEAFYKWAYEAGYDDNKKRYEQTLDRIDVDGDYEPNNCRWVTQKVQSRNTSHCRYIEYNGEKITVSELCERFNITYHGFVTRRLKKGMNINDILADWTIIHNEDCMEAKEAAEHYGVCTQTIKKWIKVGKLKTQNSSTRVLIPKGQTVQRYENREKTGNM